jgi:2-oxoglutarate ferredoxin oxidoreductase subunit gamma
MRGGTANCTVTLSEEKIPSPVASNPDVLVAMNAPSLEKFEPMVRSNGRIFVNSSLIKADPHRTDIELLKVPAVELAREIGSERAANMIMIGAVCGKTNLLTLEETIEGMQAALKGRKKFFALNEKAIARGFTFASDGR